jgi:triphosphoribosyl-dephospho-CoA synthase
MEKNQVELGEPDDDERPLSDRIGVSEPRDISRCAILASLLEVSASPKPGNVHRLSSPRQHDKSYEQFLSAIASLGSHFRDVAEIGFILGRGNKAIEPDLHLGPVFLAALGDMMEWQNGGNLLLGHVLLLLPLAVATGATIGYGKSTIRDIRGVLDHVLASGNTEDVINLYEGIQKCNPGGMGAVDRFDLNNSSFDTELRDANAQFRDVFAASSETDWISQEWMSVFRITFLESFPRLRTLVPALGINDAIVQLFLELLATRPDSLILRKSGQDAVEVTTKARACVDAGGMQTREGREMIEQLDAELVERKLNPGTTADLIAAAVFLLLVTGFKL